ncbi:MAG: galactokinase, partial [Actinobacteria bacterium]|nr:galactokinase [Actinomycetota bacterium]
MRVPHRWFAPGRVNLIGEHTDYNEGFALPVAIQLGCRCTLDAGAPGRLVVRSHQKSTEVTVSPDHLAPGSEWLSGPDVWAGYAAGVLWAAGRPDLLVDGVTVEIDADLPAGAGLSSSAALCCSVAGAVLDRLGEPPSAARVAALAMSAETEFVGAPTGGLDQLAVTHGRAGHAMLCDLRDDTVEQIPLPLDAAGLAVVVVDTGAPHDHVGGEYADRRAACRAACAELGRSSLRDAVPADLDRLSTPVLRRRVRHVLTENARVLEVARLLRAGAVADIGPLLTASHESMRDDYEITVPRVDARSVGALIALFERAVGLYATLVDINAYHQPGVEA